MIKYIIPDHIEDKHKLMQRYGLNSAECATMKYLKQSKFSGEYKILIVPNEDSSYELEGLEKVTLKDGDVINE